ncbi:MAG: biotin--[acetyl-CoA-carboxylase] ligase [Pseudomonadota bacterium]
MSARITDWPILWHEETDSTNEDAKRRAHEGPFDNHWIAARQQTSGRGRLGRKWVSPPGNLYTTGLINWPYPLETAGRLPFVAALAVRETVAHFAPDAAAQLKWPNDVRIKRAKVSGILIESGQDRGSMWVAVGIGLNVAHAPEVAEQSTTCLSALAGRPLAAELVLPILAERFQVWLDAAINGFDAIRSDWLNHAEALGGEISVLTGEGRVTGVFETLAPDGALILRLPNGEQTLIRAGDVQIRQGDGHAAGN